MKTLALEGMPREGTGKGTARNLRRQGLVPAVVYGREGARNLALHLKDLQQILKSAGGSNSLLEFTLEGKKKTAILKDVQHDPIRRIPIHVDIFEVSMDQKIKVMVEVKPAGENPVGFKVGGILTHTLTEVEVECLASDIPGAFEVDLSALDVGDSFHVSNLPNPGVKILTPGDQVLFTVVAPTIEKEPEPVEGEAAEGSAAEEAAEKTSEGEERTGPKDKE